MWTYEKERNVIFIMSNTLLWMEVLMSFLDCLPCFVPVHKFFQFLNLLSVEPSPLWFSLGESLALEHCCSFDVLWNNWGVSSLEPDLSSVRPSDVKSCTLLHWVLVAFERFEPNMMTRKLRPKYRIYLFTFCLPSATPLSFAHTSPS